MKSDRKRLPSGCSGLGCDDIERLVDDYLDGLLSPILRRACEAHLGECASCRRVVFETRQIIGIARELGEYPVPKEVGLRLRHAVRKMAAIASRQAVEADGRFGMRQVEDQQSARPLLTLLK